MASWLMALGSWIEITRQRLIRHRRTDLAADIAEARAAYTRGEVRRGTSADLMDELGSGAQVCYSDIGGCDAGTKVRS